MQKYLNNVQDQFGNALPNVTVTINENPGGGLAAIFSDDGVTPKANPFVNDSDGEFNFYAANGRYDINLTGPLTESIVDIRLLDIAAIGATLVINTDIATATTPTTELVTGNYEIWDLDNTDLLAQIGFVGNNTLGIRNRMHGGQTILSGENAAGTFATMFAGDPDGVSTMMYAGAARFIASANGVVAIKSTGNTDTEARALSFWHQDGTGRGFIGHNGAADFNVANQINSGSIIVTALDAGAAIRTILVGDPDGVTTLTGDTNVALEAAAGETSVLGIANGETQLFFNNVKTIIAGSAHAGIVSVGNVDNEDRYLALYQAGGTRRGVMGFLSGASILYFRNEVHGSGLWLQGENAGGSIVEFLRGQPDSTTVIAAATDVELHVNASEDAITCVANGAVTLYYDAVSCLQTRVGSASAATRAQVKHADGNFYDIGLAKLVLEEITASQDIDNTNQQFYTRKSSGGAVTLELQNDSNIQTGVAWQIANNDAEDITIDATTNTCVLNFFDGGGVAPPTGNRTLAEAGVMTIIKVGVAEYDCWGNAGLT